MKLGQFDNVHWETWFHALNGLEQEWFEQCAAQREEDYEAVLHATAELNRIRQRGMQRVRRRALGGVA